MPKDTGELENEIKKAPDVRDFWEENTGDMQAFTLAGFLQKLLAEKQLTRQQVAAATGLDKSYVYHIFAGQKRPGREKLLAIALAMRLDERDAQHLLHYGGAPSLYPRDRWDSILLHALHRHLSVMEANDLLDKLGETTLLL